MSSNSPDSLIHDIGVQIASFLGLPNRFGSLVRRYAKDDGFLFVDSSGAFVQPTQVGEITGWHYIERVTPVESKRSLSGEYDLTTRFVVFGTSEVDGAEWHIANALERCGDLENFTTDIPTVVNNNFPSLASRLQTAQPGLFAGEFIYTTRFSISSFDKKKLLELIAISEMIHDTFHATTHN